MSKNTNPNNQPVAGTYAGIFFLSASVLLFELALTRLFSVVLWSNLAFMIVSTALFGFGLSGVYLALRSKVSKSVVGSSRLPMLCLSCAVAMLASYAVVSFVPFQMWQFDRHPINFLYLAIWEISLLLPFFFAGLSIAGIMSEFPARAGRLYGVDLLGAAVGSVMLLFIISVVGAVGTLFTASALAVIAAVFFVPAQRPKIRGISSVALVLVLGLIPKAEKFFPIQQHQQKRSFSQNSESSPIYSTRWSPLSRVDIADDEALNGPLKGRDLRAIWIDGGTNESIMLKMAGQDIDHLPPQNWLNIAAPYAVLPEDPKNVLVIGAAGGRETLFALSHGAHHVDALEMDPSIYYFVNQPDNAAYMGGVYQNKRVNLVNDEGRSFLKRMPNGHYDVIQSLNNYTPAAMAAGALNLSETFLITKEAFHDYFDHLTPNGIISFHRGAALRVALTAVAALRERGVEHPEQNIVIANGEYEANQGIFIKTKPWTAEEIEKLHAFLKPLAHFGTSTFLWVPVGPHNQDPFYAKLLRASESEQAVYEQSLSLNLTPATDDKPFIEHSVLFGKQDLQPGTPPEFKRREQEKWGGLIPRGDFPYVAILAESAVLAFLFVGLPLLFWARGITKAQGFFGFMAYFASLGFGFIVIEICLMKRFILFLGHPVYSITAILVTLLCGAGVGSLLSERLGQNNPRRVAAVAMIAVALLLLAEIPIAQFMFAHFLKLELVWRFVLAAVVLFPLGVALGMPFTLGITLINKLHQKSENAQKFVAWAWGVNGYTTVIGSALTVFLALFFGFNAAMFTAAATYLLGLFALLVATRGRGLIS